MSNTTPEVKSLDLTEGLSEEEKKYLEKTDMEEVYKNIKAEGKNLYGEIMINLHKENSKEKLDTAIAAAGLTNDLILETVKKDTGISAQYEEALKRNTKDTWKNDNIALLQALAAKCIENIQYKGTSKEIIKMLKTTDYFTAENPIDGYMGPNTALVFSLIAKAELGTNKGSTDVQAFNGIISSDLILKMYKYCNPVLNKETIPPTDIDAKISKVMLFTMPGYQLDSKDFIMDTQGDVSQDKTKLYKNIYAISDKEATTPLGKIEFDTDGKLTSKETTISGVKYTVTMDDKGVIILTKKTAEKATPEKKEKGGEDLQNLLSSVNESYPLTADLTGGTGKAIGYEMMPPSNDKEKPKEYQERATLLMLNYITINGEKLFDIKKNISKYKYDKDNNMFTLQVKVPETVAEGGTEDKTLNLKFSLVENSKFGNKVEFKLTSDDKQITAGKFMVYDISIPTTSEKEADVRIIYNRQKTIDNLKKEMAYSLVKPFEKNLSQYNNLDFLSQIKLSDGLGIEKQGIIDNADLSNETKYETIEGYYKKVFINYQGDYREVGKIYFKKDGTLDTDKMKDAELKIYDVDLKPTFTESTTKGEKEVNLNIDDTQLQELNDKINKQKNQITDGLTSLSKNVDTSLMTNLQREKLQDLSNITLYPLRDLYSYNVIEDKGTAKKTIDTKTNIYFRFSDKDAIQITNYFGEDTKNQTVVEVTDTKKRGKSIQRDFELMLNGNSLTSLETKEKIAAEILPTINGVSLPQNTQYNVATKTLTYYDAKGSLSASINCESPKTEKESKRELLNNTTLADPLDFFDVAKTGTCATLGQTEKENIFKNLMAKELNNKLTRSSTIRVLKDSTKMIYEYYTIQDNKDGSFTTEKDKELIQAANKAMEKMKNDFLIIDKINTTSLKLWEKVTKKEKDLSINSGLGGIGICNVTAENIIKFIQSYEKTRELSATIGKDESTANLTTNKIEFLPKDQAITFSIKKNSIDLKNASTTIANESYTLDYDNNGNKLLFEKGKAKEPAKKKD